MSLYWCWDFLVLVVEHHVDLCSDVFFDVTAQCVSCQLEMHMNVKCTIGGHEFTRGNLRAKHGTNPGKHAHSLQ